MAPAPATDGTVAAHRRAGRGRFWSVRVQLLAPVLVAVGGLAALVTALLAVADAQPSQLQDSGLATAAREIAAVAAVEHLAAIERDQVRALFTRGALRAGDLAALGALDGARAQRESEFGRVADEPARRLYADVVSGSDVDTARRMLDSVLRADLDEAAVHGDAEH